MRSVSGRGIGVAATLWGVGGLWYLVMEAVAATGFPGYSYSHNYISDLGVPDQGVFEGRAIDSQLANAMNAGFLGQALMADLAGVILWWSLPQGHGKGGVLALALTHSFGLSLVGLVNGSPSNVEAGLSVFHFGGALMAIIGGNVLIILAGTRTLPSSTDFELRRTSILLGIIGLASLVMLIATSATGTVLLFDYGIWERVSVYTIVAWQLLFAVSTIGKAQAGVDRNIDSEHALE